MRACEDRIHRKSALIEAGLQVPTSRRFGDGQVDDAIAFALTLRRGVVLKPRSAERPSLRRRLRAEEDIRSALRSYQEELGRHSTFLVEQFQPGAEYAFYVVGSQVVSVVRRSRSRWSDEIYRAGPGGFGHVDPHLLDTAVEALHAMPSMPHGMVVLTCRDIEDAPDRATVLSVSPKIGLVARYISPEWSLHLSRCVVAHAARGQLDTAEPLAMLTAEVTLNDVHDSRAVADAITAWMPGHRIDGEVTTGQARTVTTTLRCTPGQAAALSGLAHVGKLGGRPPETVSIRRLAEEGST
ncbi:hypothetical protein BCY76_013250 [Nesterenkonia sp. PF2B19]|nr:hypothetical protein BCY76_013250 [Nesterenkonia sp. PF2B19]